MRAFLAMWLGLLAATAYAQGAIGSDRIAVELVADGPPRPGEDWTLALHFTPSAPEWHGYWSNPGDAGLGMSLDWTLPEGWQAGEPLYPLPGRLVIGGLMNHVYKGDHAVLVPLRVPADAAVANLAPIALTVRYLACTDTICVPQQARLTLDPGRAAADPRFARWRAALVPPLGTPARFEIAGERLRIGLPLPAASDLGAEPHVFLAARELGGFRQPEYTGVQTFIREGDLLVAEIPLKRLAVPQGSGLAAEPAPGRIAGILDFGDGRGVRFEATPGNVPLEGVKPIRGAAAVPPLWQLLLAALAGGLLLNLMPCVFPILSLKALALARAGGEEAAARRDALAYTAGVVLACAGLGALILLLRSAGLQIGWAFQLQEPSVLVALLVLGAAITANFLGAFEVPGVAVARAGGTPASSFATGLLAAFVATPCTGPFMALALGAALLLRPVEGLAIFTLLGVGLALPFLLVGFVPVLRRRLPRPGAWMERFRRWMALPMGLTVAALLWLLWRVGGAGFVALAAALAVLVVAVLWLAGRTQRQGQGRGGPFFAAALALTALGLVVLPPPSAPASAAESLLDPAPFSEAALAEARSSGKPVFVWFTADWCVTCKVNESVAIERESTRAAFARAGVIALRGDFTRQDPDIAAFLTRHGAAGVPLYLWYAPGGEAETLPQVLTPELLAGLAEQPRPEEAAAARLPGTGR